MSNDNLNAWKMAGEIPTNTRDYFGQINLDCVLMVFPERRGAVNVPLSMIRMSTKANSRSARSPRH